MQIKNSVVIVTGGTKGIGLELVLSFAKLGAIVYTNYGNDDKNTLEFQKTINERDLSERINFEKCSVSDFAALESFVKKVKNKHSKVDIIINNAASFKNGYFSIMSCKNIDVMIDTNLKGTINACRLVTKSMILNRSGIILNISSISPHHDYAGTAVYSSTKAAIETFTKILAKELLPYNIKVLCVVPSLVNTRMLQETPENFIDNYIKTGGTILEPTDVAKMIVDVCQNSDEYTSGAILNIGF